MARVNIVKRIKSDGRWLMRSVPKNPSGEWDWKALLEGCYYIEWYNEGVRRRESGGSTVAQALEVQRRKKHQIDGLQLGLVTVPKPAPPPTPIDSGRSLRSLIDRYLDQVETLKKPNTYRKYEAVLNRFAERLGDSVFEAISVDELNGFVVHLKKSGMEANTVLQNVVIIAQFFKRNRRGGITAHHGIASCLRGRRTGEVLCSLRRFPPGDLLDVPDDGLPRAGGDVPFLDRSQSESSHRTGNFQARSRFHAEAL